MEKLNAQQERMCKKMIEIYCKKEEDINLLDVSNYLESINNVNDAKRLAMSRVFWSQYDTDTDAVTKLSMQKENTIGSIEKAIDENPDKKIFLLNEDILLDISISHLKRALELKMLD